MFRFPLILLDRFRHSYLAVLLLVSCVSGVHAQNFDRIAPKLPPRTEGTELLTPGNLALPAASQTRLGVELKGIVFLNSAEQFSSAALGVPSPVVDASRVPALSDSHFTATLVPYLGRALVMSDLAAIRTLTLNYLRAHQKPFVEVTIPPQNLGSGVMQVIVSQYKIGRIQVDGARYFSPSLIRQTSGLQPGQTLELGELQTDLDRLNRNPFLNVDAVFQPGGQASETDIQLKTRDELPLRFYSGYDNLGTRGLGIREFNAGVNWGNAFGAGQIVSYQYTRSFEGAYASHSVSDAIPLRWGDQILIFGSYASEHPLMASIFNDQGNSGQASIRYVRSLPHLHRLTQQAEAGYDFKTTNNTLEFAGFHVFGAQAEVDQFPLIYDGTVSDHYGQTAVQNTFVYSPGRLTPNNTTAALSTLVPGAKASYLYNRLLITRTMPLPESFSAVTRFTVQDSDHNLPYSEQIGGGGVGSVRGYYTDTGFGSRGELFSQELRLPAVSGSHLLDRNSAYNDKAQLGVFFDYADLRQVTPIPDVKSTLQLASTGFLARYSSTRFFDTEFDLGRRLCSASTVPLLGWYGQISLTGRF